MKRKEEMLKQQPLKINNINSSGEIVVEHWHNHTEVIMVMDGEAEFTIKQEKYKGKKGDVFFINRTNLHKVVAKGNCHILGFVIPVNEDLLNLPIGLDYDPMVKSPDTRNLLLMLYNEYPSKNKGIIKAYVKLILKLVIREVFPKNMLKADRPVIDYIKNHYSEKISIEDIADSVNLSKYYFIRKFKEENGITVNSYLTNIRIEKALELLNDNSKTLEVAEKCGFSDEGYFCKVFKKVTGLSVRDYKRLYQS
ncbi:MAG: AraC family transcriptional regulator [Clostridia bacterium]|nr:AraC family transcriptional regulator [Clostridia bacterium]